MSKYINTSNITNGVALKMKAGTLQWQNFAVNDVATQLSRTIIGDSFNSATPYVMYGLNVTYAGNNLSITSGVVLWYGVLYSVASSNITLLNGYQIYLTSATEYNEMSASFDPCIFSDGSQHNIHAEDVLNIVQLNATPQSGFRLQDAVYLQQSLQSDSIHIVGATGQPTYSNGWGGLVGGGVAKTTFTKLNNNIVSLEFNNITAGLSAGSVIFTLPIGYRPLTQISFPILITNGGSYGFILITINTNGDVSYSDNQNSTQTGGQVIGWAISASLQFHII